MTSKYLLPAILTTIILVALIPFVFANEPETELPEIKPMTGIFSWSINIQDGIITEFTPFLQQQPSDSKCYWTDLCVCLAEMPGGGCLIQHCERVLECPDGEATTPTERPRFWGKPVDPEVGGGGTDGGDIPEVPRIDGPDCPQEGCTEFNDVIQLPKTTCWNDGCPLNEISIPELPKPETNPHGPDCPEEGCNDIPDIFWESWFVTERRNSNAE